MHSELKPEYIWTPLTHVLTGQVDKYAGDAQKAPAGQSTIALVELTGQYFPGRVQATHDVLALAPIELLK